MPDPFGLDRSVDFDLAQRLHNASQRHPLFFEQFRKACELVANARVYGIKPQNSRDSIKSRAIIDFLKQHQAQAFGFATDFCCRGKLAFYELENELNELKQMTLNADLSRAADEKDSVASRDDGTNTYISILRGSFDNEANKHQKETQELRDKVAALQEQLKTKQNRIDELEEENHTLRQAQSEQPPSEFRMFQRYNGG